LARITLTWTSLPLVALVALVTLIALVTLVALVALISLCRAPLAGVSLAGTILPLVAVGPRLAAE
jgi:hypothetical protein